MSVKFSSWSRHVLAAGLMSGSLVMPQLSAAQTVGTDPASQIEASAADLTLFLEDPAAFLTQEGDLAALVASAVLSDPSIAAQIVSLVSESDVSAEQAKAIGEGLGLAAAGMIAQGNSQQGMAILQAAALSPSSELNTGFYDGAGDIVTALINAPVNLDIPDAPVNLVDIPDAPEAPDNQVVDAAPADIGGDDAVPAATTATSANNPGENTTSGQATNTTTAPTNVSSGTATPSVSPTS